MVLIPAREPAWLAARWVQPVTVALALLPLAVLVGQAVGGALFPNPIEALVRGLGDWTLRLLLITLAVTPARRLTGWTRLVRLRRTLGLVTFAYATLHLLAYVGLDQGFHLPTLWTDISKRAFIILGLIAFGILALLAATSPKAVVRRLGGRRWRLIHRLIYPAAILGVIHHAMMVRAGWGSAGVHAVILALLLAARLPWGRVFRRPPASGAKPAGDGAARSRF